ncbi:MAG: AAA family ATPase [Spirochaetales bacterium]|nr:AAA family ATPase [Spirochaetales bacterium]
MEKYYRNNREHIYDELLLVDLLIQAEVVRFRSVYQEEQQKFKGLYISEQEVDELLKGNTPGYKWTMSPNEVDEEYESLIGAIKSFSQKVREKIENSLQKGMRLNLIELSKIFTLTSREIDILCICLAPHFHTKYRKLFAYLQNDVTKKNPQVDLIVNLLSDSFEDKLSYWKYFSAQSPLFKNKLLEYIEDPYDTNKPLLSREIKVNNRIVGFLLESSYIDDDLAVVARLYKSDENLADIALREETYAKLQNFRSYYKQNLDKNNFIFSFYGPHGSQKLEVASSLCSELGILLLEVDLLALHYSSITFEYGMDLFLRESKLIPAALFLKNCDFLFAENSEESYLRRYFIMELDKNGWLTFLGSEKPLQIQGELENQKYIEIHLPVPSYIERKLIWEQFLSAQSLADNIDIKEIAGRYNLTRGQIRDVVSTADTFALWRSPDSAQIEQKDLREACSLLSNKNLQKLAVKIVSIHTWSDIILPEDVVKNLKEIADMVKYKHIVYSEWGFDRKLSLGKGVSALFYGEPGTGKTLAAEVIARDLSMEIYKIDISTVVSKYVGETEKNLHKIFTEAETSNAILFFDEADALFGKRTEVKDAHDRYANIEVSYLLQKIDEYTGLVILATNFSKNIDEAFERRLHFAIHFPFPDEASRLQIWMNIFPGETPLAEEIDFKYLANKLPVAGGHIKNIALQAAFFAAESGGKLTMEHIMRASRREFDKMGRLWDKREFTII